jgi:hypothetical protein
VLKLVVTTWSKLQLEWRKRHSESIQHLVVESLSGLPGCKRDVEILSNHGKRGTQAQLREILAGATICTYELSVGDFFASETRPLTQGEWQIRGVVCFHLCPLFSKAFWNEIFSLLPPSGISLNKRYGYYDVRVARNMLPVYLYTLCWCFPSATGE